ncbi:MAG: helix-turn-helix domain-containing protein [Halolamina sp.]
MFRATIYLDMATDCVLSRVTGGLDRTFRVTQEEVIDDEHITFVVEAADHAAEFQETFEASPAVSEVERVDGDRLLLTKRSCGALPVIRANHGMLEGWDRINGDQRVFDVVVYRRSDLRAIVSELRELGTVRLGRLTPYRGAETLLSDRQSEVVRTALERGYFDWPRETDAETLAADLGIAHSTFLEHLRKAEAALLDDALSRGDTASDTAPGEREFMLGRSAADGD